MHLSLKIVHINTLFRVSLKSFFSPWNDRHFILGLCVFFPLKIVEHFIPGLFYSKNFITLFLVVPSWSQEPVCFHGTFSLKKKKKYNYKFWHICIIPSAKKITNIILFWTNKILFWCQKKKLWTEDSLKLVISGILMSEKKLLDFKTARKSYCNLRWAGGC